MPATAKKKTKRSKLSNAAKSPQPKVRITHPDRIVYPGQGITKGEVANYYVAVAKWILPHVTGRPLVLVRCPDGIGGQCFYQKHPPNGMPDAVERIRVQEKTESNEYAVIHDLDGLMSLIQFGTMEIHTWGSRADDIEHADRVIFDLDPDPSVPWKQVVSTARLVRDFLSGLDLVSFVKTTGGKGLHVVMPLERKHSWPEVKEFAKRVADKLVLAAPDKYLATMSKAARRGKIFIDYLRNERGATSVVAYSSRAKLGAAVSTPIAWEELSKLKSAKQFTIENLPARLRSRKSDPWKDLPNIRQALTQKRKKLLGLK